MASGGCYDFNGEGEFIIIDDDPSLDFGSTEEFSLGAWIKTSETDGNAHIILNKRQCTGDWPGYALFQNDWSCIVLYAREHI